ncbi:hypothetical protein Tco_1267741 [Tanacetum coccineum]
MMKEWMARQAKANERMKNHVVELERKINEGLRNYQAIIENLEMQFEALNEKIQRTKSLPRTTNTKPRHEFEDEIEPIQTMPNPSLIISNLPTVPPFLKNYTVHIPYTQEKVFEHDEMLSHVGDKELNSIGG